MKKSERRRLFSFERFFSEDIREKLIKTKRIWLWVAIVVITAFVLVAGALGSSKTYKEGDIAAEFPSE